MLTARCEEREGKIQVGERKEDQGKCERKENLELKRGYKRMFKGMCEEIKKTKESKLIKFK